MEKGAAKAGKSAAETMRIVREAMGLKYLLNTLSLKKRLQLYSGTISLWRRLKNQNI
jgi:hypothetical protein